MGSDARVRYTKKVIRETFIQLVREKPFHKITLTEVCRLAEINRTTFYKYYADIYDWKEQLEKECLDRSSKIVQDAQSSDVKNVLTLQLQDMKDNVELYGLISSPNFESNVLDMCLSICLENADEITKLYPEIGDDCHRLWNCYFVVYGMRGAIECWLKRGMKEAPEDLAAFCTDWIYKHLDAKE